MNTEMAKLIKKMHLGTLTYAISEFRPWIYELGLDNDERVQIKDVIDSLEYIMEYAKDANHSPEKQGSDRAGEGNVHRNG